MRCTILAVGSRGDVQPLLALGIGLRAAGVSVRVATHRDFEAAVRAHQLEYFPLIGHASSFFGGAAGNAFRERVRKPAEFRRLFDNYLSLFFERFLRDAWAASEDADVVLSWSRIATSLTERLKVPVFVVSLNPVLHLPTSAFPNPFQGPSGWRLGPLFNRLTWRLALPATRIGETQLNAWRRDQLGLAPIGWREELRRLRRLPHLLGYSPSVLPRPRDWARSIHVTGYWFLDEPAAYQPPADLAAFVEAGPPPIAVGFSSQVGRNAAAVTRTVVDAVTRAEARAVLVSGFGGLKGVAFPPHVFPVRTVPYDWLLPRVRAMVHHGGAGSTATALRVDLPNLAVPFGYDQALWGARVHALGAGPAPIPVEHLTGAALADAIRRMTTDARMRERAAAVGAKIRAEDGTGAAVRTILAAVDGGLKDEV